MKKANFPKINMVKQMGISKKLNKISLTKKTSTRKFMDGLNLNIKKGK